MEKSILFYRAGMLCSLSIFFTFGWTLDYDYYFNNIHFQFIFFSSFAFQHLASACGQHENRFDCRELSVNRVKWSYRDEQLGFEKVGVLKTHSWHSAFKSIPRFKNTQQHGFGESKTLSFGIFYKVQNWTDHMAGISRLNYPQHATTVKWQNFL